MSSKAEPADISRPRYHFTPTANWLNDPNGLVYFAGEYHLFFQYHPDSLIWGPMHWGHAVSRDLVNWQHLPLALYPDEHGQIFSGSAVVDFNNTAGFGNKTLVAFFTHHNELRQCQSLAYSTDRGRTWTKYAKNPLILPPVGRERDFRDPKVFWFGTAQAGHWVMSLAAGNEVLFYASPDLKNWQPTGRFGSGYGSAAGVWETPDLFELPVAGSNQTRWILMVGVGDGGPAGGSATQYFVGDFDGQTFRSDNSKGTILWVDFGADFYAAQSWSNEPNGRRLVLAWMNNWQYARGVPASTWRGMFSFPRELGLRQVKEGIRLVQRPAAEFNILHGKKTVCEHTLVHPGDTWWQSVNREIAEIRAEFHMLPGLQRFGLRMHTSAGELTTIGFEAQNERLFVDRTRSGLYASNESFAAVHFANITPINGTVCLQICVDRASLEIFAQDGLVVFSESIFPTMPFHELEIVVEGGSLKINRLELIYLNPDQLHHIQT